MKATGKIVEFRARIAMIRRHVNAAKESVQRFVEQAKNADGNDPGKVRTAIEYPYAAILDASDATEYQFPAGNTPVDSNVAAIQADLRAAAAALSMPEYMMSGNAENNSYSSTLVAEGPAVKTFEELQAELIDADTEILEKQLVVAAKAGLIFGASGTKPKPQTEADDDDGDGGDNGGDSDEDSANKSTYILDLVKLEAEPPIIKHEEAYEEAQADQIIYKLGVMSKATLAARHKMVYADEHIQIEAEQDQDASRRAKMQAMGFQFDPMTGQMIPPPPANALQPQAAAMATSDGGQGIPNQESLQEDVAALTRGYGWSREKCAAVMAWATSRNRRTQATAQKTKG